MRDLASNLSKHAKWFARFLVGQWDLDPSLGSFRIIDASGGKTKDLNLSHDRLEPDLLPQPFHDTNIKFAVVKELISCGFIQMSSGNVGVLTPQIRAAVEANFLPPHQPFLTKRLRPITKKVARILSWYLLEDSIPDYFFYDAIFAVGGRPTIFIASSNRVRIEAHDLTGGESPLLTPEVLRELQDSSLVKLETGEIGPNNYNVLIRPEIHDAVASNFELASKNSSMHVNTMYVNVDRAIITGLTENPAKLADAIAERLLPFLQANAGMNKIELESIHDQLNEIRDAATESESRTAIERFWTTLGRTADVAQVVAAMVTLIP